MKKVLAIFLIAAAGCAHRDVQLVDRTGGAAMLSSGNKLKLTRFIAPEYPAELIKSHIEGTVEIEFDVVFDGTVTNLTVTKSAHPKLDELALIAVAAWKFEQRDFRGRKKVRFRAPIKFEVKQK